MRNTVQKQLILNTVNSLKNHATADAVYDEIIKIHPTISRATVYRNLNQLAQNGVIKKVEIPNGADRYDHLNYNHYHAKCDNCGKVIDIEMEYMTHLEDKIKNINDFEYRGHDVIFSGICLECRNLK